MPAIPADGARPCHAELFERLLALDHSRRPPWGPLHGVVVPCHLLQQEDSPVRADDARITQVLAFVEGGLPATEALWSAARRRNSHRAKGHPFPKPIGPLLDGPPASFAVTITDVAVDGTFPATGHADRVNDWAIATLAGWGIEASPDGD